MKKGYKRILALLLTATLLTGCGKKKVDYNNAADGDNATLEVQLQLNGMETWQEDIATKHGNKEINSTIVLPDTASMYTYTVHERYLSNEDKKNIMTYFVDESSIKVDTFLEPTKEWLQEVLDFYGNESGSISEYTRNYLEEKMDKSPFKDELSENVGDYDSQYYLAENDDYRYYFEFHSDSQYNISSFGVKRVNKKDMEIPENKGINNCSMTREEAEEKAKSILYDLGIKNVKAVSVEEQFVFPNCYSIEYEDGRDTFKNDIPYDPEATWYEGYIFVFSRDINGVGAFHQDCLYNEELAGYEAAKAKPYSSERIVLAIDDNGIIELSCEGLMDEGTLNSSVKLLSFARIQDIIREELKQSDRFFEEETWPRISLTYMRMENKDVADEYCYIPVWCFYNYYHEIDFRFNDVIIVNAIDGKVMNPIEDGLVSQYASQFEIGRY